MNGFDRVQRDLTKGLGLWLFTGPLLFIAGLYVLGGVVGALQLATGWPLEMPLNCNSFSDWASLCR